MSHVRCVTVCAWLLGPCLLAACGVLGTDDADGQGVDLAPAHQPSAMPGADAAGMAGRGAALDQAASTSAGTAADAPRPGASETDGDVGSTTDAPEGMPVTQLTTTVGTDPSGTGEPTPAERGVCRSVDPALVHVDGAGNGTTSGCTPRTCMGLVDIAKQWETYDLGNDPTDLAPYLGCTVIEGDLHVAKHAFSDLSQLTCLERVTGNVLIWNSPQLVTLHGLESLLEVDGSLEIGMHDNLSMANDALVSLDELGNLRTIGGGFGIAGGTGFEGVGALLNLQLVGGDVFFQFFYGADDLYGFNSLKIVGGDFNLWRTEGLKHVSGLPVLDTIGGDFVLWGATDLQVLDGPPSLGCIGGNVNIGGDDSWENNAVLREVHVFPALRTLGGTLILQHNLVLESFDMLGATEHVGELYVHDNPVLKSLALGKVTSLGVLDVQNNAQLDSCPLKELAARVLCPDCAPGLEGNLPCP